MNFHFIVCIFEITFNFLQNVRIHFFRFQYRWQVFFLRRGFWFWIFFYFSIRQALKMFMPKTFFIVENVWNIVWNEPMKLKSSAAVEKESDLRQKHKKFGLAFWWSTQNIWTDLFLIILLQSWVYFRLKMLNSTTESIKRESEKWERNEIINDRT